MAVEPLPQPRDDPPCRADRQLLPDHLEDQRPERVERGKLVQPRPRMEVRARVDQLPEYRIGAPQGLTRIRVGDPGVAGAGTLLGRGLRSAQRTRHSACSFYSLRECSDQFARVPSKSIVACVPSQKGLFEECPQRQMAIGSGCSITRPPGAVRTTAPETM